MKHVFVGCIHGEDLSEGPEDGGETAVPYDGDSSTGSTDSLYQVQDGVLGGCSDGFSIPDPVSRRIGRGSSRLGLNPVKTLQPLLQLRPG